MSLVKRSNIGSVNFSWVLNRGQCKSKKKTPNNSKSNTVKLGYNEPLGVAKFVRYNREFIITGIVYGITHGFTTKKCVHYNREFVINEFVITE
jgi:hypothetical protein